MDILTTIMDFAFQLQQVVLDFTPFHFTSWQVDIALLVLYIVIDFFVDLLYR